MWLYLSILVICEAGTAFSWMPSFLGRSPKIVELEEISKEFHWKIKNFSFSDEIYNSSSFTFAGESWHLALTSKYKRRDKKEYILIILEKESTGNQRIKLGVSISLKNMGDSKYLEKHYGFFFDERPKFSGVPMLSKEEFSERTSELIPSGTLTVICTLKHLEYTTDHNEREPADTLLENFKDLYKRKEDCDVIIRVKGQDFPAHKLILKARSPVFASIFRNDVKKNITDILRIEDCDPSTFSKFLRFLYCADVNSFSPKNVFSLFTTAHKYDVTDLKIKCVEFIKESLSVDTFFEAITLSLKHPVNTYSEEIPEYELKSIITNFFVRNTQNIIETDKWKTFITENPKLANELFTEQVALNKISNA